MAPVAADIVGGEPSTGFWGPRTSTLDWCEGNYATTDYVAEFWNTVSNIVFIIPPLFGIFFARRDNVDTRFIVCYIGVISIGIGSISFHLTLHLFAQMLDEMSMLWSTSFFLYCMMETNSKSWSTNVNLIQFLYIYNVLASLSYIILQQPLLFQVSFGTLTVIIIARAVHFAINQDCCRYIILYAVFLYAIAFTLWNIDNLCCEYVQWFRDSLPPPLSGLSQLHAWWHVLVGIACHTQIIFSCHQRNRFLKRRCTVWTWCGFLPFIEVHGEEHSWKRETPTSLPELQSQKGVADISLKVSPRGVARREVTDKFAQGWVHPINKMR